MSSIQPEFIHRFFPGEEPITLLLLHGTGGDENNLISLGRELVPTAALLSPRGHVLEGRMPRFFRRLAEGVFDMEDLVFRTHELADFVHAASSKYGFDLDKVIAIGYSNGANIAASVLFLRPEILCGAVLFRAMVPLEPEPLPNLSRVSVFMASGRTDQMIPANSAARLAELLREAGADVTLHWQQGGHSLSCEEVHLAREWLSQKMSTDVTSR